MKNKTTGRGKKRRWIVRVGIILALAYPTLLEPAWIALEEVNVPIAGPPKDLSGIRMNTPFGFFVFFFDIKPLIGYESFNSSLET